MSGCDCITLVFCGFDADTYIVIGMTFWLSDLQGKKREKIVEDQGGGS
jgi:hypothetical protein